MIVMHLIILIVLHVLKQMNLFVYYLLFIPIYTNSLNCPFILSKNKELAPSFAINLKRFAKYKLIYTRNEKGVKIFNRIKRFKWLRFI